MAQKESDATAELRELTREHAAVVWKLVEAGGTPTDMEDRLLAQGMKLHKEWHDVWEMADVLKDVEYNPDAGEVNPFLHVSLHAAIESQIENGKPKEVRRASKRLRSSGLTRHEAIHEICTCFVEEIWHCMAEERPFDNHAYVHRLRTTC